MIDVLQKQLCADFLRFAQLSIINYQLLITYWGAMDDALYDIGNTARVSGWGFLTPNGRILADCLQAVDVNVISNAQATNMFNDPDIVLGDHEVATTGVGNVRQGACHGDSGGPLTTLTESNEPVLIGIVSWGRPNCTGNNTNSPSVFVRVSNIANWIASNVITISGPSSVCPGTTATYSVSNASGLSIIWLGSLLTPHNSSQGTSKTFTASSSAGIGWVSASITVDGTQFEIARKTVSIVTNDLSISGPTVINVGGAASYSATLMCPCSSCDFYWTLTNTSTHQNVGFGYGGSCRVLSHAQSQNFGYGNIHLLTVTSGGVSESMYISSFGDAALGLIAFKPCCDDILLQYISSYPNPVSNILNIEIDAEAISQPQSLDPITNVRQLKIDSTIDLRLYDAQGNLLRQQNAKGGTIQFNVSNLPNGIYYLHIYDGVNSTPEMRQIVVEH